MPADNYKLYSEKLEGIPVSLSKINIIISLTLPRLQTAADESSNFTVCPSQEQT